MLNAGEPPIPVILEGERTSERIARTRQSAGPVVAQVGRQSSPRRDRHDSPGGIVVLDSIVTVLYVPTASGGRLQSSRGAVLVEDLLSGRVEMTQGPIVVLKHRDQIGT